MTDGDRRIANMRLRAGGEVTPESARHMGLFVVGRLADRHGIRVRLRGSSTEQARSGTTAEVYLPATVLAGCRRTATLRRTKRRGIQSQHVSTSRRPPAGRGLRRQLRRSCCAGGHAPSATAPHSTESPISLLPRRRPGSSGITGAPADKPDRPSRREPPLRRREEGGRADLNPEPPAAQPVSRHLVVPRLAGAIHPPAGCQSRAGRAGAVAPQPAAQAEPESR